MILRTFCCLVLVLAFASLHADAAVYVFRSFDLTLRRCLLPPFASSRTLMKCLTFRKSGGRISGGGIKASKTRRENEASVPASVPAPAAASSVTVVHAPQTVVVGGHGYGYGPSCGKERFPSRALSLYPGALRLATSPFEFCSSDAIASDSAQDDPGRPGLSGP